MYLYIFQTFGDMQCILYVCLFHSDSHLSSGQEFKGSLYEFSFPLFFFFFFFFFFLQSWFSEWIELKPLFSSWNQRVFSNVVYLSPPNALRAVQHMWTILRPPPEVEVPVHFTFHTDMYTGGLGESCMCEWPLSVRPSLQVSLVTFENISFTHSLLRNIM